MRFFISLLLLFSVLTALIAFTVSCGKEPEKSPSKPPFQVPSVTPPDEESAEDEKIVMPPYKEYPDRETVSFSEIVYARPNVLGTADAFNEAAELIRKNEVSYEEQLSEIVALEDEYAEVLTMRSVATVLFYQDSTNAEYQAEYTYLNTAYPVFLQSLENLFVSAAASPNAERFEDDYFGEGLIETYRDGGIYTDEVVLLMEEETVLESEFESLSPANIKIVYKDVEDTAQNHIDRVKKSHAENSKEYLLALYLINSEYQTAYYEKASEIYVELLKIRALIAEEMGKESYLEVAYKSHGYEYTDTEMTALLSNIQQIIVPIYTDEDLYAEYQQYQSTSTYPKLSRTELINTLYSIYKGKSETLADIYAFMLQFGLYDVDASKSGRYDGAFTTYFKSYDAPFLFATVGGRISDYMTVAHEFGHFADMFQNDGESPLLHLSETFSEGLELLSLSALRGVMSAEDYAYLKFNTVYSFLQMLTVQGFYAAVEHEVYALEYSEITRERLDGLVERCAEAFGFEGIDSLFYAIIPHTVLYPFYVQSYCLSAIPALEIYFAELDEGGAGFALYEELLDASGAESIDFSELLTGVGLSDPYEKSVLEEIARRIYYDCMGKNPPAESYPPGNAA